MPDRMIMTSSSEETYALGQKLGQQVNAFVNAGFKASEGKVRPLVKFGFTGDLGAGKTLMIKGIMSQIMPEEDITSPTYTIINEYDRKKYSVFHVDLYRITNTKELLGTGFLEALENPRSVMFIEWIDRLGNEIDNLCKDIVTIDMHYTSSNGRKIMIKNWSGDL